MDHIGIMQGRLSPPERGKLQFFPTEWEAEFPRARELGFAHIQWFLDREKPSFDPIYGVWTHPAMLAAIDRARSILPISSIDAGKYLWFGPESVESLTAFTELLPLIAGRLSTGIISLPLLKHCAPKTEQELQEVKQNLTILAERAQTHSVRLALEMELTAPECSEFIDSFGLENIGVTYDTGNAAALGHDCSAEIKELGERIFEVHLKDAHPTTGVSVRLGEGIVDFNGCFQALAAVGYRGAYTLQAWRGDEYLTDAKEQLVFVKQLL